MKYLSTAEFSKATGIATGTLRRWATDRKLIPAKMQGKGQPSFYSEDQLQAEVVINFKPRALTVQLGDGGLSLTDRVNRIRRLSGDTCRNMIEIGRHLIAAKAEVEHGNWTNWLEENFGWTDRTARNFMAVADRFGDMDVVDFKPSTLQALLALPVGSEQGFIAEQAALGKPVENQPIRQLKAAVEQANHKKSNSTKRKTFSDLKSENRANTPTPNALSDLEHVDEAPAVIDVNALTIQEVDSETVTTSGDNTAVDSPADETADALIDSELTYTCAKDFIVFTDKDFSYMRAVTNELATKGDLKALKWWHDKLLEFAQEIGKQVLLVEVTLGERFAEIDAKK